MDDIEETFNMGLRVARKNGIHPRIDKFDPDVYHLGLFHLYVRQCKRGECPALKNNRLCMWRNEKQKYMEIVKKKYLN